jgi:hypothetical protein
MTDGAPGGGGQQPNKPSRLLALNVKAVKKSPFQVRSQRCSRRANQLLKTFSRRSLRRAAS